MKQMLAFLLSGFITQSVFADTTCGPSIYKAIYDINTYTCDTGKFLPANTLGCVACPPDATCPGGTFDFNPTVAQGILFSSITSVVNNACADNLTPIWVATYDRNTYTCNPGYYVPANNDGCVTCPADSYCPGGTYTFNETETQGITACATGLYAPAGMWEPEQCGRILHVGQDILYLRSTKKTSPALNFDMDGDNVADFFASATTADVPMNVGTTRRLRFKLGNTVYSVHDDTVTVPE